MAELNDSIGGLISRIDALIASIRDGPQVVAARRLPRLSAGQSVRWSQITTIGSVAAQILPSNAKRWSVIFGISQAGNGYALANQKPNPLSQPALVFEDPNVTQFLHLDYPKHGTLVGQEWWGYGLSAGGRVVAVEVVIDDA